MKDLGDYQYSDLIISLGELIGLFLRYGDDKIYIDLFNKDDTPIFIGIRIISIPSEYYECRVIGLNDLVGDIGTCLSVQIDK